jgi:nicotinate-nucleotide pyrophosphorylase (carboxylating)
MPNRFEARLDPAYLEHMARMALDEDGAWQDITTFSLVDRIQRGHGVILGKDEGIVCGLPIVEAAFHAVDPSITVDRLIDEGKPFSKGDQIATVDGPFGALLRAERVALNFLQRMSGTATLTHQYVEAVRGLPVRIMETRKTTPGLRALEKYAVLVGGGHNHRFNLADGILVKDNHIAAWSDADDPILDLVRELRRSAPHPLRVEIEVTSMDQALEALAAGVEILLLDNMTPDEMKKVVEVAEGRALTEASGGIRLDTVRAVAEAGVNLISAGALTHSARALDISLNIELL